jgi:hypothetical protein
MGSLDFLMKAAWLSMSILLPFGALGTTTAAFAQSQPAAASQPAANLPASITGTIVDKDGAVIPNASITLSQPGQPTEKTQSGSNGTFTFPNVAPGPFELTADAPGFATQKTSGSVLPGQPYWLPPIQVTAATKIEVDVAETQEQVAEEEMHVEETQRVFGVIPNYYVTYEPNPAPLNMRQKYHLAWRASINPVSFGISALIAGLEQSGNYYSGFGKGWQGYGKRLGANYADSVAGTFIAGAILPSVFRQDPRYYYRGTGTRKSRLLHALAASVICRGDNGHWEPNYSNMLGALASGALSNAYYPASDRNGVGLTFENAAIGIGGSSFAAVVQEFFLRSRTDRLRETDAGGNERGFRSYTWRIRMAHPVIVSISQRFRQHCRFRT